MLNDFINNVRRLCHNNAKVMVAVSGGSDSICLLKLFADAVSIGGLSLELASVTFDHGLRKESEDEARYVSKFAASLGVEHTILYWNRDASIKLSSVQSQAREARYNEICLFCKDKGYDAVAVGHHMDDQAETVFMNLVRGSGLDGLCGIPAKSNIYGVEVIRPLMGFHKEQVQLYLRDNNIEWIEDPSNQDKKYTRSLYRDFLNTQSDSAMLKERISKSADHLSRVSEALEFYVKRELDRVVELCVEGYIIINREALSESPLEVSMQVILHCIMCIGGLIYKPRYRSFSRVFSDIMNSEQSQLTIGGCIVRSNSDVILVIREVSKIGDGICIESNVECVWDNRFICNITVNRGSLYELCSLGMDGWKYLLAQKRELKYLKLHRNIIYSLPCIKEGAIVLSCPLLGYNMDGLDLKVNVIDNLT